MVEQFKSVETNIVKYDIKWSVDKATNIRQVEDSKITLGALDDETKGKIDYIDS